MPLFSYLFSALPPSRQVAVFSATYPRNLDQLLSKFMRDASLVRLNSVLEHSDCLYSSRCEPTCSYLENAGFLAASISAQISQTERDAVIEKLKQNKLKVLVSTDLTARGIDATNVNLVVNLETAINAETYFHRIGRAARYGGYGAAITIVADSREVGRFKAMVAKGGVNVRIMDLNGIPPDLTTNQSYFESCPTFQVAEVRCAACGYIVRVFIHRLCL
ncbi:helicase protein [Ancylostoma duodenale]|uniref:Helicase protein n=1 Tax=Ancylostoma duodenale TaxID=51022 RepID=A0A0C2GAD4_9BILA|nr:helicase protein [Ancylostoma duodenale]